MFKFTLTLFVFLVIFAIGTTADCNPDEVYEECGPYCEPKCGSHSKICPTLCKPGCTCKPGLVRRSDGRCVPAEQC